MSQKAFFSTEDHHTVVRCTGDNGTMVVSTVLDYACTGCKMELIAADTDLLIMLIYVWNSIIGDITINSEATKKHKAIKYDVDNIAERINNVRKYLILVYALDECNTTSAAYKQDKLSVVKLLEKFKAAREEAHIFLQKDRTAEAICEIEIILFAMLYCGKDSDSLTDLRYLKYMKMASSSRTITLASLPPASRVKHTNGNCPRSKRLWLGVRRSLFGASYYG